MSEKYDVLMSEEIMKIDFINDKTFAKVTRCALFEKGSNINNFESRKCDMDKAKFLLVWADNKEFCPEIEGKFIAINKNNPQINITISKSLLSEEEALFNYIYDEKHWNSKMSDTIQIYDILLMIGIAMVNNEYLFDILPPFDTIKSLINNLQNALEYIHKQCFECCSNWDEDELYDNFDLSQTDKDFLNDIIKGMPRLTTNGGFCPWNSESLSLLVSGYIRNNYTSFINNNFGNDLGSIVFKYLQSRFYVLSRYDHDVMFNNYNSVICNFSTDAKYNRIKSDEYTTHDDFATAILTPFISEMISIAPGIGKEKGKENKKDSCRLEIKIKEFECLLHPMNSHDEFNSVIIECGVIGLRKSQEIQISLDDRIGTLKKLINRSSCCLSDLTQIDDDDADDMNIKVIKFG